MTILLNKPKSKPGNFDTLKMRQRFPTNNEWGIPMLPAVSTVHTPKWLAPYRKRIRTKNSVDSGAVHFFTDDYRFETAWKRPFSALNSFKSQGFKTLLTPDFSLYTDLATNTPTLEYLP